MRLLIALALLGLVMGIIIWIRLKREEKKEEIEGPTEQEMFEL